MKMHFDPSQRHRRSVRLRGYDYSLPGFYFLTICIQDKLPILGRIANGRVLLYKAGEIVRRSWEMLPSRFPSVALDMFVVMPDHVHGTVRIAPGQTRAQQTAPTQPGAQQAAPLHLIVRAFKSTSAVAINRLTGVSGRRVWQRNYYERIVRNQDELEKIRGYISQNPLRWTAAGRDDAEGNS